MANTDEIKEHLDHILVEVAKTQDIASYELNPNTKMNYGDGFVAQFFTGEIKNKDTGNSIDVAIKKAPFWEFDYKPLFVNEDLFYKTAFSALDTFQKEANVLQPFNNVPNYFCGSTNEPKKEYIAMENLKPLGYEMFDKKKFFDQEHLEFIFKTYGKFHALSFVFRKANYIAYENSTKGIVHLGKTLVTLAANQIKPAVSAAVQALDVDTNNICDELKEFGENALATFEKAFDYNGEHMCLVHGDCWSNNMLFKYSESGKLLDLKLIDFQLCRDGTPIHDLSYFFYSGASKKDFDNIEFYLQIYYKSFYEFAKELGAKPDELFSFDDLVNEWKDNALLGVIFGIWIWQVKLTTKEDFNELTKSFEGMSEEQITSLYKDFVQKTYQTSLYKEKVTSILIHAFDYGVLNKNKIVKK